MAGASSARKGRRVTTPSLSGGLGGFSLSGIGQVCPGQRKGGPVRGVRPAKGYANRCVRGWGPPGPYPVERMNSSRVDDILQQGYAVGYNIGELVQT